jgi:hypothetical protein
MHFKAQEQVCEQTKALEAGLVNKNSCLAPTVDVTKFTIARDIIFITPL